MLWVWLQRAGTLAFKMPIDIRMAVGLAHVKEQVKIEQVYRVDGYSVYYRQGNEFADAGSAVTPSFAAQGIMRRVNVILHEELHGDANFDLLWDIEEAVVTPLGSLATVEYFKQNGDVENMGKAQTALNEGKQIARELHELVREAQTIFDNATVEDAKQKVLRLLPKYPAYQIMFDRQIAGQHAATALEAKLSHDLAYFRYFEAIAGLAEGAASLNILIEDLKRLPRDATTVTTEKLLRALDSKYLGSTN
jgi:hypothetical protein